ncbi:MAG TPA: ABC transporter ATP-binding protein [Elusimicrobiota bacterium]|nr:ABC transporter ATP-binding protein [Elusimicrobiota bacterium]
MSGAWAVEAEGLTVRFGEFTAVDDVSFRVPPGEIFGFLGANGAGKTTTIRVLCGLLLPSSGRARVAGLDVASGLREVKHKVGYMSQRFTLYDDLTVEENLAFAAALRKMPAEDLARRTKELFEVIGFDRPTDQLVRDLPGGFKQELSLAVAMLHGPEIVFLDEPTAGVAPGSRARFWALIRRIAATGKTVFVTTHYMDEAEQCGRIALMRTGKLIALDSPAGLKRSAFPEPLYELQAGADAPADWTQRLKSDPSVIDASPYGLRWHAGARDEAGFRGLLERLGPSVRSRRIQPTLEDVFVRLVEGKDR